MIGSADRIDALDACGGNELACGESAVDLYLSAGQEVILVVDAARAVDGTPFTSPSSEGRAVRGAAVASARGGG